MKWIKLIVFISLVLQQANKVQASAVPYSHSYFLNPGIQEKFVEEDGFELELPKYSQPYFSSLNGVQPIKIKDQSIEDDIDEKITILKRLNSPKPSNSIISHHEVGKHTPPKQYGRGAKIATVVGTASVILGGAAIVAHNHKRSLVEQEQVDFVKRGGRRGAGRTKAARERREQKKAQNNKSGVENGQSKKSGMSKTKAGLIGAGGMAAGATAMHVVGKSGGGSDSNALPA